MAKRKTKRKTKKQPAKLDKMKMPILAAGYATRIGAKDMLFGAGEAQTQKDDKVDAVAKTMFYDKSFVDTLKKDTPWTSYKVGFTTTPRPNAPHTFTQQDVFKALQDFGNNIMDLIDASISNDRQRKAFKKFVNASYEKQMEHTKGLARNALRFFNYDLTEALKNTETSNANL